MLRTFPAGARARAAAACARAAAAVAVAGLAALVAALPTPARAQPDPLPPEALRALQRAQVPEDALVAVVMDLQTGQPALVRQADRPVNPASLAKLVTTAAALDRLGPAHTWTTPVWLQGRVAGGVLDGSLVIAGRGDPTLTVERLWLLLRRVQHSHGVREIRGDIVLDASAFAPSTTDPAAFDGEPLRPYNVQPHALLANFHAVTYSFVPDAAAGVARVGAEPALAGASVPATVPLAPGPCEDWRAALKATFSAEGPRFAGRYPAACGDGAWPVADPQPATYTARLVEALWKEMGGTLTGRVRAGTAPAGVAPSFEWRSRPLAEVVREVNKFSNNPMAEQLAWTLDLQRRGGPGGAGGPASAAGAREALTGWLAERFGELPPGTWIANGSGLSRETRLSARLLARLLQRAWDAPWMPDFAASLPISGQDGTLRRSRAPAGRAYLKTGSLRDVAGIAGYVTGASGRRWLVVAIVEHPNANAARPALDALAQWVAEDAPPRAVPAAGGTTTVVPAPSPAAATMPR